MTARRLSSASGHELGPLRAGTSGTQRKLWETSARGGLGDRFYELPRLRWKGGRVVGPAKGMVVYWSGASSQARVLLVVAG